MNNIHAPLPRNENNFQIHRSTENWSERNGTKMTNQVVVFISFFRFSNLEIITYYNPLYSNHYTGEPTVNERLLRRPEVESTVGLSRSNLYRRMSEGSFPKPVSLGGRLVAWKESDIQKWIDDRIKATEIKA